MRGYHATRMPVTVVVQVRREASPPRGSRDAATQDRHIAEIKEAADVQVEPMHPESTDPVLASYFLAELPDEQMAQSVVDRLSVLPNIEAAYIKPAGEAPL